MKKEKSSKATQQVKRVMEKSEKQAALESALTQIEKAYGKGSVMKLGEGNTHMFVETIPTGSLGLDIALGVGGIPKGRIIEVYGPESSGKTTVALHMVAEAQKLGGIAAFIDAEHALDPVYADKIGVNIDELYVSQPDNGEQALEITETMVRSGAIGTCTQGRDRRRYGRFPYGLAGKTYEPGTQKAYRYSKQEQLYSYLYQPAKR